MLRLIHPAKTLIMKRALSTALLPAIPLVVVVVMLVLSRRSLLQKNSVLQTSNQELQAQIDTAALLPSDGSGGSWKWVPFQQPDTSSWQKFTYSGEGEVGFTVRYPASWSAPDPSLHYSSPEPSSIPITNHSNSSVWLLTERAYYDTSPQDFYRIYDTSLEDYGFGMFAGVKPQPITLASGEQAYFGILPGSGNFGYYIPVGKNVVMFYINIHVKNVTRDTIQQAVQVVNTFQATN